MHLEEVCLYFVHVLVKLGCVGHDVDMLLYLSEFVS